MPQVEETASAKVLWLQWDVPSHGQPGGLVLEQV